MQNDKTVLVTKADMKSIIYDKRINVWKKNRWGNNKRGLKSLNTPIGRIKIRGNRAGCIRWIGWI